MKHWLLIDYDTCRHHILRINDMRSDVDDLGVEGNHSLYIWFNASNEADSTS